MMDDERCTRTSNVVEKYTAVRPWVAMTAKDANNKDHVERLRPDQRRAAERTAG